MDYKNIMASIVNDLAKKTERPGPRDWHDAELGRMIVLESCLLEVQRCQDLKEDPRHRTMTILELDTRVGVVLGHLNVVERKWASAQNNYTPEKFADFVRQGGFVSSGNKLVTSHDTGLKSSGESDPDGLNVHAPGAKLDEGKLLAGLVLGDFSHALEEVVKVGTFGANKYSRSGWLEVQNAISRYTDALYRHLLQHAHGKKIDKDSGLTHLAHATWNLLAITELTIRGGQEGLEGDKKNPPDPQGGPRENYKREPFKAELERVE